MDSPSVSIRVWAQRLLASEAANKSASAIGPDELLRVSEKLRIALTQFVGADGVAALMRRALALTRRDNLSLQTASVTPEGRLERNVEYAVDVKADAEAAVAVTAHLLTLLVTFIGEPLTLRLLRDVWPDESKTSEPEDLQ